MLEQRGSLSKDEDKGVKAKGSGSERMKTFRSPRDRVADGAFQTETKQRRRIYQT